MSVLPFELLKQTSKQAKTEVKELLTAKGVADALRTILPTTKNKDLHFICIGTDRSTGDSLGPLVGRALQERGYTNCVGTLDEPVHAMNLVESIDNLPKRKIIIAIDACLSQKSSIGTVGIGTGPIKPGAGVNKELPSVGQFHIHGIVNVGGFMEYFVLQNTRLSLVMKMATMIADGICAAFPLEEAQ